MNRGNIHSPSVAEECEGRGGAGGCQGGGRKRDGHSPFGSVWEEQEREIERRGRRAGVSISPIQS